MWLDTYGGQKVGAESNRRAEDGKRFGALARELYPEGRIVDTLDLARAARLTRQLIDTGVTTIFEAAFVTEQLAVRVDILQRNGDGWSIIEVKASNKIKKEHYDDVAIQKLICEEAGLKIIAVYILHLNAEHRHPGVQPLTICEEVTDLLDEQLKLARKEMPKAMKVLRSKSVPNRLIGSQCKDDCPHYDGCFEGVPKYSVFNIPRLADKKDDLIAQNIIAVSELPTDYQLTATQRIHSTAMSTGSPYINAAGIAHQLRVLKYPLHFLDFETIDPAMPVFDGTWPYQHIPFQFSCHIQQSDGKLSHSEFLHTETSDPRPSFIAALIESIQTEGSIVAYHASYERTRLRELADAFPSYAPALNGIIARLWDQEVIFKNDYIHPDFLGSSSIKAVLPVLVPSLTYEELSLVHNGTEAQDVWWSVINDTTSVGVEAKIEALREYCKLDTLAMVELDKRLRSLVT